jgi:hypothetical protein
MNAPLYLLIGACVLLGLSITFAVYTKLGLLLATVFLASLAVGVYFWNRSSSPFNRTQTSNTSTDSEAVRLQKESCAAPPPIPPDSDEDENAEPPVSADYSYDEQEEDGNPESPPAHLTPEAAPIPEPLADFREAPARMPLAQMARNAPPEAAIAAYRRATTFSGNRFDGHMDTPKDLTKPVRGTPIPEFNPREIAHTLSEKTFMKDTTPAELASRRRVEPNRGMSYIS